MSLFSRLANVFRSDRLTRDIDDELACHVDEAAASGRDPREARRALGPPLRHREQSRDIKILPWLDGLRADLVFAWRQLNKRKITSLAAILSLGLAIGACTAAFRIIDALFLRPLPISHPERLYALSFRGIDMDGKPQTQTGASYPELRLMRDAVGDRADLLAISYPNRVNATFTPDQEPERPYRQFVSGRMFAVFGLRPALGRLLAENDDLHPRSSPVAVLSFEYWTRRFGRDPKVLGRAFRVGSDSYTIAGVAPEGFTGVQPGVITDIFVPAMMSPFTEQPHTNWFQPMAVLKLGVSAEPVRQQIQAAVRAFFEENVKDFPNVPQAAKDAIVNQQVLMEPAPAGVSPLQRDYRDALIALAVLVALVLLIASANVANLMTAQAAARAREMALRVSIGAGRSRLVQLVLVESAILAAFAAAAGGLFALWASPFVVSRINPRDNPARMVLGADWRVLVFAFALTAAIAILLALAPALRASGINLASALKGGEDPHSKRRLMYGLIGAQVAFCFLVLFVAGLFVTTLRRLSHQDLGFRPERLLVLDVGAPQNQPPAVWDQAAETLRGIPGVEAAASSSWPLLSNGRMNNFISINGGPPSKTVVDFLGASPRWMETMRIPFVAGRDFRAGDEVRHVAIVNQIFAEKFFPGEDPLGKSFSLGESVEIVGVVGNARYSSIREPLGPVAYLPSTPYDEGSRAFLVRTSAPNPLALAAALRQAILRSQPGLRVNSIGTQQDLIDNQTIRERLLALLGVFFAAVALLLAAIGLYGVLDYSVFQRRREIGIRMAVGARASHIVRGVTLGIFAWILVGSVAGLALGLASARYIASLLYQVKPTDASMLAIPALALLAAAVLAAFPPVLRAIHTDPVQTLRAE